MSSSLSDFEMSFDLEDFETHFFFAKVKTEENDESGSTTLPASSDDDQAEHMIILRAADTLVTSVI